MFGKHNPFTNILAELIKALSKEETKMENPTYEENRETQIPETTWEKLKPETIHRNNNPNPKEKLLKLKQQEDNITLYTTETCHKCARMKKQLQKSNTPYKEIILEEYEQIKKITAKSNKTSVPIMKKGNKWLTEEETYDFLDLLDD